MINYVVLITIEFLLFVITFVLMKIAQKKLFKVFSNEVEKALIINEILDIKNKACQKHQLNKYPNLYSYICQMDNLIAEKCFNVFDVKISTLNRVNNGDIKGFDKTEFVEEYLNTSNANRGIVDNYSNVLGKIYKLNSPIEFYINEIKKNVYLHILSMLIEKTIKESIKKEKEVKEKEVKEKEIKEKEINQKVKIGLNYRYA